MIKKIETIEKLAVFKDFKWDNSLEEFEQINIIYGRNYSGKTTLSRIVRAMETGELSDKYENPSFCVVLSDGTKITQDAPNDNDKKIRVFNEDFVRVNLSFIANPDGDVEPFAVFGESNVNIEKDIADLERTLGFKEQGQETGLYLQLIKATTRQQNATRQHRDTDKTFDNKLKDKAGDIKRKQVLFGERVVAYDKRKLKRDIEEVLSNGSQRLSDERREQYERLAKENKLSPIAPFSVPRLRYKKLADNAEQLVTKQVGKSDKIAELLKDATINRWVSEGRDLHNGEHKRSDCAFCGNPITPNRWEQLEKHFDEESEQLGKDISKLIQEIAEEQSLCSALEINESLFYAEFNQSLAEIKTSLNGIVNDYEQSLDKLTSQLRERKNDLLNTKDFDCPDDVSQKMKQTWEKYNRICEKSNEYTSSLSDHQNEARKCLLLDEVWKIQNDISYSQRVREIQKLQKEKGKTDKEKDCCINKKEEIEELISSKKRLLNDEEAGARLVNKYLGELGSTSISLKAIEDDDPEIGSKKIRFQVFRGNERAYGLSEGECRLLSFCYFLAKLGDIDTKGSKPIIWIDDPISSLDSNHMYFIYSLIDAEIVSKENFEQIFISTHSLYFLKYLRRLNLDKMGKSYFFVERQDKKSAIKKMPKYLKKYATEFNYLFHQIYKCAHAQSSDGRSYEVEHNFGNNARRFLEIYLYYKYPDEGQTDETLKKFFGDKDIPFILTNRMINERSHQGGGLEKSSAPLEEPEMKKVALAIMQQLEEKDKEQYESLCKSIHVEPI